MNHTIRAFIAIPLAPEIRKAIGRIQDDLKKLDCDIKWVEPENVHLTLKFLGEIKTEMIDTVKQTLEDLSRHAGAFNIALTKLGAFPDEEYPRILWVGLKDTDRKIIDLVSLLEKECEKIGLKKEGRPFSPHITIGRTRSPRNLRLLSETIETYEMPVSPIQTEHAITLYKSTLTREGPIYEPLQETRLY